MICQNRAVYLLLVNITWSEWNLKHKCGRRDLLDPDLERFKSIAISIILDNGEVLYDQEVVTHFT